MDQRRGLARLVLEEGASLSEAARRYGVSRPTARLWVERARASGLAGLQEQSRRPRSSPEATDSETVLELLSAKARRPYWGAKKLLAWRWPEGAPIALRTANRILARHGLTVEEARAQPAASRFEKGSPNELWQMDFKGLKYPRLPYEALSVIDDCSRFCLAFAPVASQSVGDVWQALWEIFGCYGLPERILTDNGPAFRSGAKPLPSTLEVRLWKLGVRTSHGRPHHPQTQGKVERFHRTAQVELAGGLRHASAQEAAPAYEEFRQRYNWERPHEALAMATPGALYSHSLRKRPDRLPDAEAPPGALLKRLDGWGNFNFKGARHKVGRGLAYERVELREGVTGYEVWFCAHLLGRLEDFRL